MPPSSFNSHSCIATMPISANATRPIHTRPRIETVEQRGWARARRSRAARAACTPSRGSAPARRAGDRRGVAGTRRSRVAGRVRPARCGCGGGRRHAEPPVSRSLRAAAQSRRGGRAGCARSPRRRARSRGASSSAGLGLAPAGAHRQVGRADAAARARTMKRLTRRSSSEWKEIAASTPPSRSRSHASGSAASSWPSSSLTAIRSAWKTRLAGCPPAKRAGAGIAELIDVHQLQRRVDRRAARGGARSRGRSRPRGAPRRSRAARPPAGAGPSSRRSRARRAPARDPYACPAARRRSRRSRARACPPASRTCPGRSRRCRRAPPRARAAPAPRRSRRG